MSQKINIEDLSKQCGDFFKKLSEYCYSYPKMIASGTIKVQETVQIASKDDKLKKKQKEKVPKTPKKVVNPNIPKKPLTAYISYFQEHKQRFEQMYPDLNLSDITKLIAKEWKQRSDEQKKPYLEKAQNDRKRYDIQLGLLEQKKRPKNEGQIQVDKVQKNDDVEEISSGKSSEE